MITMGNLELFIFYAVILALPGLVYPTVARFLKRQQRAAPSLPVDVAVSPTPSADPPSPPAAKDFYEDGHFPGPKQYPIVGRVHDLPRFSLWLKFTEWANEFGPVYQTSMLGQKFVIVSDEEIATELLVKNGNSFAGRPQIRALIDHKLGPTYSALMDRHGKFNGTVRAHMKSARRD